jgi:hypothetical protein
MFFRVFPFLGERVCLLTETGRVEIRVGHFQLFFLTVLLPIGGLGVTLGPTGGIINAVKRMNEHSEYRLAVMDGGIGFKETATLWLSITSSGRMTVKSMK